MSASQRESEDPNHHLYQRGKTWYIRYELGGSEHRESLSTTDVAQARKTRDRKLKEAAQLRSGRPITHEKTWQDAVNGYLTLAETLIANGSLSRKTADRYGTSIVQFSAAIAGEHDDEGQTRLVPLSQITIGTIKDFVTARQEEERAASTILNDITAVSRVLQYAIGSGWLEQNIAKAFDRRMFIGAAADDLNPPTDAQVEELIQEVREWHPMMATLLHFLRETGMRLSEALLLRRQDIHPDGHTATLSQGVKRNKNGLKTRTIDLGRAADLFPQLEKNGRLFGALNPDSAVTSTRYGQWRRQRQGREDRAAMAGGRGAETLQTFRIHDQRHSFAIASLIDDDTCMYRLSEHLGHSSVKTTEVYTRFLKGQGAMRRYARRVDLFGSLPPTAA